MIQFEATVNGRPVRWDIPAGEFLTETLRSHGLIGTKRGCESGDCGACAVLLDGVEVNSCVLLAAQASGHDIVTIEGIGDARAPHPIQEAFVDAGAVQCGFCTPGMVVATHALLADNAAPTRDDARHALAGHLCRCTGYVKCLDAVELAAERTAAAKGGA
ncbi:MAG: (2Fe-2S)-binding protein [Deltaproteobacteria bacterium HGW-Deltaproteobacteria-14]|nr:MAG: (2Fe-2S)-binding protein [Deltaproteobacteria bacterium HGW-Deltaproteobacteria-14]